METRPAVVYGNQLKSWPGKTDCGEPDTRLLPVVRTSAETLPTMSVARSPVRV
jgi:hypothetical protein